MRLNTVLSSTLLFGLMAAAGCADDTTPTDSDSGTPVDTGSGGTDSGLNTGLENARVRIVHTVYDPLNGEDGNNLYANLQLNGAIVVTDQAMPTFLSTGYTTLPPATYSVQLLNAMADNAQVYDTNIMPVGSGEDVTTLLWGFKPFPAGRGGVPQLPPVAHTTRVDDNTPPGTDMMRISVFNASANSTVYGGFTVGVDATPTEAKLKYGEFGASYTEVSTAGGSMVWFDDDGDTAPDGAFFLPSHADLAKCEVDLTGNGTPDLVLPSDVDGQYLGVFVDNPYFGQFGPTAGALLVYSSNCPFPDLVPLPQG
ncbi:MAG: DUF4397 domain-containing protein [Proteobacteria bacterium]|nr:DUF4397 domain-containing protein [Pseudomonadota bacterium]